ncbi:PIG-L family deacetylase [Ktedonosporobacter rubrisoli]|uniref:PIG-L family deacetylase n=1 Tax=Ktedonosporobacter rubrisoli TaxID=2509675 RepID=A0A4P6JN97_KTERU|nr:PIG-L deacetylase family protein [Ktedonosporobacter rubrisoli]QBD76779.1 PIG-L family deacetylase [Ktedonosporobacter rubrisoli]
MSQEHNKRALVVMAHPDDAEYGCAGTIAKWTQAGWQVTYVICTDGSSGGPDDTSQVGLQERQRLSACRKAEQRAACRILGVSEVIFLDYPDGLLEPTPALRRDLVRQIRRIQPARVICQSPEYCWDARRRYHADHLAAGQAAMAALYPAAQNPWDFPELLTEGLLPHKVHQIYILRPPICNYIEDISETFEIKLQALHAHTSQVGSGFEQLTERLRREHRQLGVQHQISYAEAFFLLENR